MSISRKYGRTYHYDFSPGTTSDDRINRNWQEEIQLFDTILHTEKMDGENTCLSPLGVFARSHAAPTLHPWADHLKQRHAMMVNDLKENNLEILVKIFTPFIQLFIRILNIIFMFLGLELMILGYLGRKQNGMQTFLICQLFHNWQFNQPKTQKRLNKKF